jgi:hypothetical protein
MSKKTALIAFLVVILIAIVGTATYLAKHGAKQNGDYLIKPKPTVTSQPELDTLDWKAYTSLAMGFSVKYPPQWKVSPEVRDNGAMRVDFEGPEGEAYITFTVIQAQTWYSDEDDFVKEMKKVAGNNIDPEEERILLDNHPAVAFSYTRYWERAEQYVRFTDIYLGSQNFLLHFVVYGYDKKKKETYLTLRNQLLATLRFL